MQTLENSLFWEGSTGSSVKKLLPRRPPGRVAEHCECLGHRAPRGMFRRRFCRFRPQVLPQPLATALLGPRRTPRAALRPSSAPPSREGPGVSAIAFEHREDENASPGPVPRPGGELPGLVPRERFPSLPEPLAATGGAAVCSNVTVKCHMLKGAWQRP